MIRYRIKTEKEFIEEFGPEWRYFRKCKCSFRRDMDFLLGQEINIISYEHYYKNYRKPNFFKITTCNLNYHCLFNDNFQLDLNDNSYRINNVKGWSISMDMIKQVGINYNQKKTLVYD